MTYICSKPFYNILNLPFCLFIGFLYISIMDVGVRYYFYLLGKALLTIPSSFHTLAIQQDEPEDR